MLCVERVDFLECPRRVSLACDLAGFALDHESGAVPSRRGDARDGARFIGRVVTRKVVVGRDDLIEAVREVENCVAVCLIVRSLGGSALTPPAALWALAEPPRETRRQRNPAFDAAGPGGRPL